jgi:SAM-dependent methyltransferase
LASLANALRCPVHQLALQVSEPLRWEKGVPFERGSLQCPQGCAYEIKNGIPRFLHDDSYAIGFGHQWQSYLATQVDSFTGRPYSRQRLERCLGMPLRDLSGLAVLECGAGAGRFTEILIQNSPMLVALDMSSAVEANLKNCGGKAPYFLCQADINASPLPRQFFDVVICLGVIQHTPCPEQTIASLAAHVKPGGLLVLDHYTNTSRMGRLGQILTVRWPLRAALKRLSRIRPALAHRMTAAITAICDPIRARTCKYRWLDSFVSRLLPSACYYMDFPDLPPSIVYKWNELDTHDMLTDWYKHFRTPDDIRRCLESLGFVHISSVLAGNGVEARARAPVQPNPSTARPAVSS